MWWWLCNGSGYLQFGDGGGCVFFFFFFLLLQILVLFGLVMWLCLCYVFVVVMFYVDKRIECERDGKEERKSQKRRE